MVRDSAGECRPRFCSLTFNATCLKHRNRSPSDRDKASITWSSSTPPIQSLVKSKVEIDFDTFPTVTIGRDQENVVVIPDQNVSRLHAELSRDGNGVMLKDQQSTNGTYLSDGREFQKVNDSVEVKPNSLIKFGSGTIVKLICE